MFTRATTFIAAALLLLVPATSQANLATYNQNFELLTLSDPLALSNDGWVVYGNVFTPANVFMYGYGTYPAPNGGNGFSAIATGEGGVPQGSQSLSVYNDYNNLTAHSAGDLVEADVFVQQTIATADLRNTWTFQFDAKLGNLVSPSTAYAFIKTIDPAHGYAMTNLFKADMTAIPATWGTYSISITLDPALAGQFLQFGFSNTATSYAGAGVFYDNISWVKTASAGVGGPSRPGAFDLRPASPNPFPSSTRIDYSMAEAGNADLTIYDVTGRRVATLFHGVANAGPQSATWNGRSSDGRLAPAGVYRAVLQSAAGRMTRNLVLSR